MWSTNINIKKLSTTKMLSMSKVDNTVFVSSHYVFLLKIVIIALCL